MGKFPFMNFYTAGLDLLSDFDGLSTKKKSEICQKIAATEELREQFRKEVPKLTKKMGQQTKKSESD